MSMLATARMTARPAAPGDGALAHAIFSSPEVARWVTRDGVPWSDARIQARATQFAGHWLAHGFGLRYWFLDRGLAGVAGLQHRIVDGKGAVEASFAFLPNLWGAGLATEAMTAALAEAPDICREVRAITLPDNAISQRVLAKLGFAADGAASNGDHLFRRAA